MERKICPFLGKKCLGERCMFWGVETFLHQPTQVERAEAGCLIVFQYQITRFAAGEHGKVQASVDKVATEIHGLSERTMVAGATLVAAARRGLPNGDG